MSDENISEEEEVIKRALQMTLLIRYIFQNGAVEQHLSLVARFFLTNEYMDKATVTNPEIIKKVLSEEIGNLQRVTENLVQTIERRKHAIERNLIEVDKVISAFPNISRNGCTLSVDGKILSYKVDILSERVEGFCPGKHSPKRICVRVDDPGSCTTCKPGAKPTGIAFPDITDESIRKSVQIAINLANDQEIDDINLLHDIQKMLMCPRCVRERKLPLEPLYKVSDRIISIEEQEAKRKREEVQKPCESSSSSRFRELLGFRRLLDDLEPLLYHEGRLL